MLFLFVSLACFALFAAVFAATFAIDHFASVWQTADANSRHGRFSNWAANSTTLDIVKGLSGLASALACLVVFVAIFTLCVCGRRRKDDLRCTSPADRARAAGQLSASFPPRAASSAECPCWNM